MASYSFTTDISLTNASTMLLGVTTLPASPAPITVTDSELNNMITSALYNVPSFPYLPLPASTTIDSNTAFGDTEFTDSVYSYSAIFDDGTDDYSCLDYLLVPTSADYAIANWVVSNGRTQATLDWAVAKRAAIDTEMALPTPDYVEVNRNLLILRAIVVRPYTQLDNLDEALVATANTDLTVTLNDPLETFFEGYYSELENTLTGDLAAYTWIFDPTNATPQTHGLVPSDLGYASVFLDGVYRNYNSAIKWTDDGGYDIPYNLGRLRLKNTYALVTTQIALGITAWQAAYDLITSPNTTQTADNATLDTAIVDIQALFTATNYSGANALIAAVQAILAAGLPIAMYLALDELGTNAYNQANFNNWFGATTLPSGTYTDQEATLTYTLTNTPYSFLSTYPASNTDYTEILNSVLLASATKWGDGVFESKVNFKVNSAQFNCTARCLVMTYMNCMITKATEGGCPFLKPKLMQMELMQIQAIRFFNAGDNDSANEVMIAFAKETSGCNCGCGG